MVTIGLAQRLSGTFPDGLRRRLACGSADNLGILGCRLLVLPLVELFVWLRVAPGVITTASNGVFFSGLAASLAGHQTMAGLGIGFGALLDFSDGMVARRTDRCSLFGFRYDYIMDRMKSMGLFLLVAYLGGELFRLISFAAIGLIFARELVTWVLPIRQVANLAGQSAWGTVFGHWHHVADEFLRNDPWQLVVLGFISVFWPESTLWLLSYYYGTLLVDSLMLFRSFLNVGSLKIAGHTHLLVFGADGSIKTAVMEMLQWTVTDRNVNK